MSEEEGDSLYNEDYAKKQSEVQSLYGENWNTLPSEAQGVLTDMAYNVGSQGLFNKFPGLIKDIQSGNYSGAANQLKYKDTSLGDVEGNTSNWWNQVGGTTTEGNIASGEWGKGNRANNRGTSNYDVLSGLGDLSSNQPVNSLFNNNDKLTSALPTK